MSIAETVLLTFGILLGLPVIYIVVGIMHLAYHAIQEKVSHCFQSCWLCNLY